MNETEEEFAIEQWLDDGALDYTYLKDKSGCFKFSAGCGNFALSFFNGKHDKDEVYKSFAGDLFHVVDRYKLVMKTMDNGYNAKKDIPLLMDILENGI